MCGRFILMSPGRDLAERFQLDEEPSLVPRYNIAPTQMVAVVRLDPVSGRRRLALLKWGLVPFWAKDPVLGPRLINARAESAAEKPAFRAAFKHRRCLVPADGFYEWRKSPGKRQPYLIGMADDSSFAFAGLWEQWKGADGQAIESCTILTTNANELVAPLHDRMPVVLLPEDYGLWLDTKIREPGSLVALLRPFPSGEMKSRPVSFKVNKATAEGPELIAEYAEAEP